MPTTGPKRQWTRAGLLFLGHAVNDGYGGFFAPLLPLLIERLDLSLALAGFLGTIRVLTNSLLQPSLGHFIDRARRPSLVVIGPLLTVGAMSLIGRVGSVTQLILVLLVAGIGTALFHPAAASLVTTGHPSRAGVIMALFSAGGTIGAGLAPMAIVAFTAAFSLQQTPWLIVPGVALIASFAIPLTRMASGHASTSQASSDRAPLPPRLAILWTAIVLACLGAIAFSTFLAVLVTERGGDAWMGGAAISAYLIGAAVVEFIAGNLSDRHGRKAVMIGSLVLATPVLLAFLYAPAVLILPLAALGGGLSLAYVPVGVVAAHECAPGRRGLVSGLVMGLAWGVGGLALSPIGWLADRYGLIQVMTYVALLPLVAAAVLVFYREPARPRSSGAS